MLILKKNLLQRVRVITIALVALIGFGTMAMKPASAPFDHTYGVAETAGGTEWVIQADVTNQSESYTCSDGFNTACTIGTDANLNPGDQVPIDESQVLQKGLFERF